MDVYNDKIAEVMERGVMERSHSNFELDGYVINEIFSRYNYPYKKRLPSMEFEDLCFVRYDLTDLNGESDVCYIQHWYKDVLLNDYLSYDMLASTPTISVNGVTVSINDEEAISKELIDECALYILCSIHHCYV